MRDTVGSRVRASLEVEKGAGIKRKDREGEGDRESRERGRELRDG